MQRGGLERPILLILNVPDAAQSKRVMAFLMLKVAVDFVEHNLMKKVVFFTRIMSHPAFNSNSRREQLQSHVLRVKQKTFLAQSSYVYAVQGVVFV